MFRPKTILQNCRIWFYNTGWNLDHPYRNQFDSNIDVWVVDTHLTRNLFVILKYPPFIHTVTNPLVFWNFSIPPNLTLSIWHYQNKTRILLNFQILIIQCSHSFYASVLQDCIFCFWAFKILIHIIPPAMTCSFKLDSGKTKATPCEFLLLLHVFNKAISSHSTLHLTKKAQQHTHPPAKTNQNKSLGR